MGMFDIFGGGALSHAAVGTLNIWPYISASIVIQLMTAIIPAHERMAREGETGRQKLNQTTRYLALVLCLAQSLGVARMLESPGFLTGGDVAVVSSPGWSFRIVTMLTMTSATMLLMWLGEQISERGIGNGVSLIIMVNISSRLPAALLQGVQKFASPGGFNLFQIVVLLLLAFFVFAGTVALTQGLRRVPIHTARRSAGARVVGGQNTYMPLRVNFTGVMPIIFANPIIMALGWLLKRVKIGFIEAMGTQLSQINSPLYNLTFVLMILFFSFFWVATQFNAVQIADDLKRSGGYVPGIRPGMPTAEFLDATMTRVTLIGAIGLVIIAVLPGMLQTMMEVPPLLAGFFGGTSLLIIVGVGLDTMRVIESYLVMRNYDGFLKHGRIRGRR
jgi:preprotein translocase subunit SecY